MNRDHACVLPLTALEGLLGLQEPEAQTRIAAVCLRHPLLCARCFGREVMTRKDGRCGCRQCGCGFDLLDGRWLSAPRIPARSWLVLVKCFELGLSVREAAGLADVPKSTAYLAGKNLRLSLAAEDPQWAPIASGMCGGDSPAPPSLFGVLQQEADVRIVPILEQGLRERIRLNPADIVRGNGFACTGRHGGFDALIFNSQDRAQCRPVQGRGGFPKDGFLAFFLNWTLKFRGISAEEFPLYLKECAVRFNAHGQPLFDRFLACLAARRPLTPRGTAGRPSLSLTVS